MILKIKIGCFIIHFFLKVRFYFIFWLWTKKKTSFAGYEGKKTQLNRTTGKLCLIKIMCCFIHLSQNMIFFDYCRIIIKIIIKIICFAGNEAKKNHLNRILECVVFSKIRFYLIHFQNDTFFFVCFKFLLPNIMHDKQNTVMQLPEYCNKTMIKKNISIEIFFEDTSMKGKHLIVLSDDEEPF